MKAVSRKKRKATQGPDPATGGIVLALASLANQAHERVLLTDVERLNVLVKRRLATSHLFNQEWQNIIADLLVPLICDHIANIPPQQGVDSSIFVDLRTVVRQYFNYMDDLAAYFAVARRAFENGLSVAELDEAIGDKLAAKAVARKLTGRAKGEVRPKWSEAKKHEESLPDFVARVYAAERSAGTLSKATLRPDRDLYRDYFNWRRKKNLPVDHHWLRDLPTKKQAYDQQASTVRVEDFTPAEQGVIRRYEAAKRRARRRRSPTPAQQ